MEKILIVDDDHQVGKLLNQILQKNGYECIIFGPIRFNARRYLDSETLGVIDINDDGGRLGVHGITARNLIEEKICAAWPANPINNG